jgi:imidazolonepropionase-like amidohydrolase
MNARTIIALLVLALCGFAGRAQDTRPAIVIKARLVVPVEGQNVERAAVIIDGSKIRSVGPAPAGAAEFDFPEGIVYPGLIDAGSYAGIRREKDDGTRPLLPDHRIADAFDARHPAFARNLAAGITTAHLVPGRGAVIGGRTAVVKVGPDGASRVLSDGGGLALSLVEDDYPPARAPTSLLGALSLLRAPPDDVAPAFASWRKGAAPVYVFASKPREIQIGATLKAEFGFRTVLCSDIDAGRFAKEVAAGVDGVILGVLPLEREPFAWAAFADLVLMGKPFAFATWAPVRAPATLRFSAVVAARKGIAADAALRALTIDAARLLGVDAAVGSLKPGKDADLIVLSAPIEDPRARLLLCVQDGKVVYRASKESP